MERPEDQPVTSPAATESLPRLKRTLTLRDLIFYGIVLIQPVAPIGIFGVVSVTS